MVDTQIRSPETQEPRGAGDLDRVVAGVGVTEPCFILRSVRLLLLAGPLRRHDPQYTASFEQGDWKVHDGADKSLTPGNDMLETIP